MPAQPRGDEERERDGERRRPAQEGARLEQLRGVAEGEIEADGDADRALDEEPAGAGHEPANDGVRQEAHEDAEPEMAEHVEDDGVERSGEEERGEARRHHGRSPAAKLAEMDAARIASMGAVRSLGMATQAGMELVRMVTRPTAMAVPRLMPMPSGSVLASGPRKISVASETEKRMVRNQQTNAVGMAGKMSRCAKPRWIFVQ